MKIVAEKKYLLLDCGGMPDIIDEYPLFIIELDKALLDDLAALSAPVVELKKNCRGIYKVVFWGNFGGEFVDATILDLDDTDEGVKLTDLLSKNEWTEGVLHDESWFGGDPVVFTGLDLLQLMPIANGDGDLDTINTEFETTAAVPELEPAVSVDYLFSAEIKHAEVTMSMRLGDKTVARLRELL